MFKQECEVQELSDTSYPDPGYYEYPEPTVEMLDDEFSVEELNHGVHGDMMLSHPDMTGDLIEHYPNHFIRDRSGSED